MTAVCKSSGSMKTDIARAILVLIFMGGTSLVLAAPPDAEAGPLGDGNATPNLAAARPDPSRQPFGATFSQSSSTGAINVSFGTIPANKRLVIENESVACYVTGGSAIQYAFINTNLGRTFLLLQPMGSSILQYYVGTFTNTMYADPSGLGTGDITFVAQASTSYTGSALHCDGAVVGHYVASAHH